MHSHSIRRISGFAFFKFLIFTPSLLLFLLLPATAQNARDIALVLKTIGKVYINAGSNANWSLAQRGTRLHSGIVLQTAENSLASIIFTDDKSLLKVRAKSRITIQGKREGNVVKKSLFMRLGELWAKVTKGSFYQVETPSGVAAVKGTMFYLMINEDGIMRVFCLDGLIEQFNDFGRVLLNAGEMGEMGRDTPPTKRPFDIDEAPNWSQGSGEEILEIEFENEAGEKKKLHIYIQRQ